MRITNRKGAKDAKEDDRFFSLADLRIGKRKLSVLGALSEAGGSSFSLATLAIPSEQVLNFYIESKIEIIDKGEFIWQTPRK